MLKKSNFNFGNEKPENSKSLLASKTKCEDDLNFRNNVFA